MISVGIYRSLTEPTAHIDADDAQIIISEAAIESYAQKTREAGIWNCPTIVIWQKRGFAPDTLKESDQYSGNEYLSFVQRLFLERSIKE